MATNTTNYGWTKPDYEDDADIAVLNETFDAIDAQVKTVETALNSKQTALSTAQLAAVNSGITSTDVDQIETNKNNISKNAAELVDLVDSGAKSLVDFPNINPIKVRSSYTTITDGYTITGNASAAYPYIALPFTNFKAGDYVLKITVSAFTGADAAIFVKKGNYSIGTNIAFQMVTQTGDISIPFTLDTDSAEMGITIYPNQATTEAQQSISVSKLMICTQAAWDVSQKYVPYRPTYEETVEQVAENENNISSIQQEQIVQNNEIATLREITGHNKTAIKSITTELETNKTNILSLWDNGAKNHYRITAAQSTTGIIYNKISESELSISGTYTGSTFVYFNLTGNNFKLPAGTWKFRFTTTGTVPNRSVTFGVQGQENTTATKDTDYEFTTTGAEYLTAYTQFYTNDTVDGSIRIMVRPANATDTTYQPYAMTNAEITAWILAHS